MREQKHTQKSLGKAVGVAQSAIFNWLHGTLPGSGEIYRLAKVLNTRIDWFFEVIPYREPTKSELHGLPLSSAPIEVIPLEKRKEFFDTAEFLSKPGSAKLVVEAYADLCKKSKFNLDNVSLSDTIPGMGLEVPTWPALKKLVLQFTANHGAKAALAKELKVSRQVLGNWLSDNSQGMPNADLTLELLRRVWKPASKK